MMEEEGESFPRQRHLLQREDLLSSSSFSMRSEEERQEEEERRSTTCFFPEKFVTVWRQKVERNDHYASSSSSTPGSAGGGGIIQASFASLQPSPDGRYVACSSNGYSLSILNSVSLLDPERRLPYQGYTSSTTSILHARDHPLSSSFTPLSSSSSSRNEVRKIPGVCLSGQKERRCGLEKEREERQGHDAGIARIYQMLQGEGDDGETSCEEHVSHSAR
ncbi:hypothetical protein CSUI_010842, partial [Cystoisospora suis]